MSYRLGRYSFKNVQSQSYSNTLKVMHFGKAYFDLSFIFDQTLTGIKKLFIRYYKKCKVTFGLTFIASF